MFKDSEFLKVVLGLFGVPEGTYDFADPAVVLLAVIFSEHLFVFFLSVLIWGSVRFFRAYVGQSPAQVMKKKKDGSGVSTYQYSDMSNMHKMYKTDKRPSFFAVAFKGFILPVLVIFLAITISMELAYG
tara:strand:- start:1249 stop:1635 length:387 start_codon:yes stop_codon:yes gene_type:complete